MGPAGFRRRVAVKLLPDHLRTHQHQQAFLQEARLGGLVSHPNVVSTLELVEHEGRWLLVMDLVAGLSVSQLRRRGPLPTNAVLDLARQVCQGLHHIHTLADEDGRPLGLVHRDIKPANLLLSQHGVVQIADLGIARLVGQPGMPAGTPGYMPPEQLDGTETSASDLFALGATLAHLVTGTPPFGRGPKALIAVNRADAIVRAAGLGSQLDAAVPGLGEVVLGAIRADPAERWPSARAMGEAIRTLYGKSRGSAHLSTLIDTQSLREEPPPPTRHGPLVGRDRELEALSGLLADRSVPIVMVTGPGGVGKTRLVDHTLRDHDAVRCDAARAVTLPGLCLVVAEALGAPLGHEPAANVGDALAQRGEILVVLDNLEQAADAWASAVDTWRAAAPAARFVGTSRVALRREEAVELRLGPLPADAAMELLQDGVGQAVAPALVRRLVQRVERLPLAVELVAAQARASSVADVLHRLERRSEGAPAVLHDQLEASWQLLPPEGQRALVLVASFEGAFDHHDATGVLDPATPALDRLALLVDHSVLHVRGNRFRLLPSVRAFARSRDATTRALGEERHGRWMARLGAEELVEDALADAVLQLRWQSSAEELLVAFRRAHAAGRGEVAVATALALGRAMVQTGPLDVIGELLEQALAWGLRTCHLLRQLSLVQQNQSHYEEAEATLRRAIAEGEGLGRLRAEGDLAVVWGMQGRPEAVTVLDRVWRAQRDQGDPVYASTMGDLGQVLAFSGRVAEGERMLTDAIEACEQLGDPDMGYHLGHLATAHSIAGRYDAAEAAMQRALDHLEQERKWRLCATYEGNFAEMLVTMGRFDEAKHHAGLCLRHGRSVGRVANVAQAHNLASRIAWHAGDLDEAVQQALAALQVVRHREDDNVVAEAFVALALAQEAKGEAEAAVEHLAKAVARTGWVFGETRARAQLHFARLGPIPQAEEAIRAWPLDGADQPPLQRAYARLAAGWLAARRAQHGIAKAAVLDARLALARLELPPQAPALASCEALRQELAS